MVKAEAYLYVFRNDISISSGLRSKRNNFVFSFNVIFSGGPAAACCGIMIHFLGMIHKRKPVYALIVFIVETFSIKRVVVAGGWLLFFIYKHDKIQFLETSTAIPFTHLSHPPSIIRRTHSTVDNFMFFNKMNFSSVLMFSSLHLLLHQPTFRFLLSA